MQAATQRTRHYSSSFRSTIIPFLGHQTNALAERLRFRPHESPRKPRAARANKSFAHSKSLQSAQLLGNFIIGRPGPWDYMPRRPEGIPSGCRARPQSTSASSRSRSRLLQPQRAGGPPSELQLRCIYNNLALR